MSQKNYISHYENLKNKWTQREKKLHERLWQKHKDALEWLTRHTAHLTASAASIVMLTVTPNLLPSSIATPASAQVAPPKDPNLTPSVTPPNIQTNEQFGQLNKRMFLINDLYNKLPTTVVPLTPDQEERITGILSVRFGLKISAELNGIRLNQNYGYIGEEQHLVRYPGDSMNTMFSSQADVQKYWGSGMAPGRGAWGYWADSAANLTPQDIQEEKWYIAVPTFLSLGYNQNVAKYNSFFKYRKMLVVNPQNGKAVVADIADSGPSPWTGKQLGGSPEVMNYLDRQDGAQKGPVLYFFIDDSNINVPLGPINIQ